MGLALTSPIERTIAMITDDPNDTVPERPELPDRAPDRGTTSTPTDSARPTLPDRSTSVTARREPEAIVIKHDSPKQEGSQHPSQPKSE